MFMLLAVLAMVALAYSVGKKSDSEQPLLVPVLGDNINDIQSVSITSADNALVAKLTKSSVDGNDWIVSSAGDYPADVGELRRVLMLLADAQLIEQKTSDPDYYYRLGVRAMDDPEASGVQIDIAGLPEPVSIILGDSGINGNYTYVRRTQEEPGWLVSGKIEPGRQTRDWLDRTIVDLTSDRVQMITIAHPDGETVVIGKSSVDEAAFTLENMRPNELLSFEGVLNAIAGVPTRLELDGVVAQDDFDAADQSPVVTSFMTFDGLLLEFAVYNDNNQGLVKLSAAATKTDAEAEAEAINARTSDWVFQVPGYKASQLTKRESELLKTD
jgi:hypothetical protein